MISIVAEGPRSMICPSLRIATLFALAWVSVSTLQSVAVRVASAETATPVLKDDGLYEQPWFLQSFLDLREDLAEATAEGKRFAIIWELKGCPYCRETHLVNFADPEIREYVRDNFVILQLNLLGAREVTDFDGEVLEERALARKHGIAFTPTVQFFPAEMEATTPPSGRLEIARMPGYFKPPHFLAMFQYVREKSYATMDFREFLKSGAQ